jgi:hypothetical protein
MARYMGVGVGTTAMAPALRRAEAAANAAVLRTETELRFTMVVTSTRSPGSSRGSRAAKNSRRRFAFTWDAPEVVPDRREVPPGRRHTLPQAPTALVGGFHR